MLGPPADLELKKLNIRRKEREEDGQYDEEHPEACQC